jgi:predicted RNA binding protein YcfA (HicA-like mRNA interferase family)
MAQTLDRRTLIRWLLDNGFTEEKGGMTSHRQFSNGHIKVTVKGHGPKDIPKSVLANIVRQLLLRGKYSPEKLRKELGGAR